MCVCIYIYIYTHVSVRVSQVAPVVKNPPANAGVVRDTESIPGLVRSPREGDVNTLTHTKQMCMLMNIKACYQECS